MQLVLPLMLQLVLLLMLQAVLLLMSQLVLLLMLQLVLLLMFQAVLMTQCIEAKMMTLNFDVFVNFVGASPGSVNIVAILRRFCFELTTRFQLPAVGRIEEYM